VQRAVLRVVDGERHAPDASLRAQPGDRPDPIHHPFALTARYGRGTVLRLEPRGAVHETAGLGDVPLVDAVAVRGEDGVALFAANRHQTEAAAFDVDVRALGGVDRATHTAVFDDPEACNTVDRPDRVVPRDLGAPKVDGGRLAVELPPLSWNLVRLRTP